MADTDTDYAFSSLVDAAEDPAVTTGYTDYFTSDGRQTTLATDCQGAARIQARKEGFLRDNRRIVVGVEQSRHNLCAEL